MGRKRRIWIPDLFYHIVCGGNRRDPLFMVDNDFKVFFQIMNQVNEKTPFEFVSYCLMTNHYHLQLRSIDQPVSKVMSLLNKRYADYYNTKNKLSGHVFEKRYYDKIIYSEQGMLKVSRYIHFNPVRAKMTAEPESYQWSDFRYYTHTLNYNQLNMNVILDYFSGDMQEKRWVSGLCEGCYGYRSKVMNF